MAEKKAPKKKRKRYDRTIPAGVDWQADPKPMLVCPHWFLKNRLLRPSEKLVLMALLHRCNPQNDRWPSKFVCWPSDATISKDVGQSLDSIRRALHRLKGLGAISTFIDPKDEGPPIRRIMIQCVGISEDGKWCNPKPLEKFKL